MLTLIGFLGDRSIDGWLFDWASGVVTLALGPLLFATMPIMPFTEQYTRETRAAGVLGQTDIQKGQPSAQPGVGRRIVIIGLAVGVEELQPSDAPTPPSVSA